MEQMNWWQAVILGLVEGLTEYLPVSSTGHLILAQRVLGIVRSEASDAYAICIQAGAILAVLVLYWERVRDMIVGTLGRLGIGAGNRDGFALASNIIVAFLPAAVLGKLFDDKIEAKLFGLKPIIAAWLVGGLAILWVARFRRPHVSAARDISQLTWPLALTIGVIQCLAMWPGTSRSLVTIVGGILMGLSLASAVEFSFLLGVLTLLAATVYKAKDAGPVMLEAYGWTPMLIGTLAAWISAVIAVKWMVAYLNRYGMSIFGYYRVALAFVVGACMYAGVLVDEAVQAVAR